ncbi:phospholipase B1, membrane-associated isoform X2 [Lingula anatina]|uniref:Phospholipase B1, membrane-associated n=1 Tax=Lingula anatina TaxID=7574 RepID=A0A1S3JX03_LINAN|nr:phospholipase B1, membrane-associated isoform X2 [Lingula anatina]|eukprot:XP_013414908.1 phospholipase B1, membrane-associated isoform X2 [Lingula anatina]
MMGITVQTLLLGFLFVACTSGKDFTEKWYQVVDLIASNATLTSQFLSAAQQKDKLSGGMSHFPCAAIDPSPSVPTSVHQLRPSDVQVVAAMGDSLTAGTGIHALTVVGDLFGWRGVSWSIGGDEDIHSVITLPNILKQYNPNIKGFSIKKTLSRDNDSPYARLNVAKGGDKTSHMPDQARKLVSRMKSMLGSSYATDWKVITLFIGGNNLCSYCEDPDGAQSPEQYITDIRNALDILHQEVPRAFVNLVEVFQVELIEQLNLNLLCNIVHSITCDCAAFPKSEAALEALKRANKKYGENLNALADSGRYDTRDDFTVVVQPFFRNTMFPTHADGSTDSSFVAADCFHLSGKGQAAMAEALWNNMVEPVGGKRTEWRVGEALECPTNAHPYFYTKKNSNPSFLQSVQSNAMVGSMAGNGAGKSYDQLTAADTNTFQGVHGTGIIIGAVGAGILLGALLVAGVLYRKYQLRTGGERRALLQPNPAA